MIRTTALLTSLGLGLALTASPAPAADLLLGANQRIDGAAAGDAAAQSIAPAGDVNGDKIDDFIIGAPDADHLSRDLSGAAYVVFGSATPAATVDLNALGSRGFVIGGSAAGDRAGTSVAAAGDLNDDNFDDVLIRSPRRGLQRAQRIRIGVRGLRRPEPSGPRPRDAGNARRPHRWRSGRGPTRSRQWLERATSMATTGWTSWQEHQRLAAQVPRGRSSGRSQAHWTCSHPAGRPTASAGSPCGNGTGAAVAGAGDLNADGRDDLLIGAPDAGFNGRGYSPGRPMSCTGSHRRHLCCWPASKAPATASTERGSRTTAGPHSAPATSMAMTGPAS